MYKLMVYDITKAESAGVRFENPEYIWVDIENGIYVAEENATIFKSVVEAYDNAMEYETAVEITN